MDDVIRKIFLESIEAKEAFLKESSDRIVEAASLIAEGFKVGAKLLIFGNGGSAADAQHIAGEFVNRFLIERPPLPALALTTDTSVITSIGNDYDYKEIFSKQIKALGKEGDIVLAISTSGDSSNVIEAVKTAKNMEMKSIGLTGKHGGTLATMVDIPMVVRSSSVPRIQEVHLTIAHTLCELVDFILFHQPTMGAVSD
ncbi:MAG: D-sedoheptulose 7-phosphate isomerase [Thermodesulfobacteriota bacterium]